MTETEKKALELVQMTDPDCRNLDECLEHELREAICRAIEQHEAFKREVSDAVESLLEWPSIRSQGILVSTLNRFIIAKPDPLVEAMSEAMCGVPGEDYTQPAKDLRAALAARGGRIVWEGE